MGRRFSPSLHMVLVLLGCSAWQSTAMFAQRASPAGPRHDYEVAGSPVSPSPVDKQIAATHGMQLAGHFLIGRDGIIHWLQIEAAEGIGDLSKFPSDEEILQAARSL